MHESGALTVSLPARSENLARVRSTVADAVERLGVSPSLVHKIRLAVNEACSNVVRHAYDGEDGDMIVVVRLLGRKLVVCVYDRGRGRAVPPRNPGAGFGLTLIRTLSDSLEILDRDVGSGTAVRMTFALNRAS